MNRSLLELFVNSGRDRIVGRAMEAIFWRRPILGLQIRDGSSPSFFVVLLETPGPFCFLSSEHPLCGADAPVRFSEVKGLRIARICVLDHDRVVRIDTQDTGGQVGGTFGLFLHLFGSYGRAELKKGANLVQRIGGRAPVASRSKPPGRSPDTEPPGPRGGRNFFLLSRRSMGKVAPATDDDHEAAFRFGPFDDPLVACEEVGSLLLGQARERIVKNRLRPITRRFEGRKSLLVTLKSDLEKASGYGKLRRETETLAAYQSRVPPGSRTVTLPDIYDPNQQIRFELDPAAAVSSQIEKRFKRAAKMERSGEHILRRISEIERELKNLDATIEYVGSADFAGAMIFLDRRAAEARDARETAVLQGDQSEKPRPKMSGGPGFRRFELDKTWFVLVGRSNKENEKLTFHTASPMDMWFHAQHVPGSHVVLKSRGQPGSPPASILEKAASIAAYYSRAKHSGLVPVIYTRRKYVRKPRGARPGQVVCEREKTLLVAPKLPPSEK